MAISHRLHTPMDQRPGDGRELHPKRIVFLSVEGNRTEKDYFELVNRFKNELNIQSVIHIEVLSRWSKDTQSDPRHVFALLQEVRRLHKHGILAEELYEDLGHTYTKDFIEKYFREESLPSKEKVQFERALEAARIDYAYQKFLSDYRGEDGRDVFAIIIDRDKGSHTAEEMIAVFKMCEKEGVQCFVTNPCFEFWLLLHVSDVRKEFATNLDKLLANEKVSSAHTYVSAELSKRAKHKKTISESVFREFYLKNIDIASERCQDFSQDKYALLDELGSNVPKLFEILRGDLEA